MQGLTIVPQYSVPFLLAENLRLPLGAQFLTPKPRSCFCYLNLRTFFADKNYAQRSRFSRRRYEQDYETITSFLIRARLLILVSELSL